jgi:hypothetical protein
MDRSTASRRTDPVWTRIDSIQMSEREKLHAKEMLQSAERRVDFVVKVIEAARALLAPARRALQR